MKRKRPLKQVALPAVEELPVPQIVLYCDLAMAPPPPPPISRALCRLQVAVLRNLRHRRASSAPCAGVRCHDRSLASSPPWRPCVLPYPPSVTS
jgi:hypothetical protein